MNLAQSKLEYNLASKLDAVKLEIGRIIMCGGTCTIFCGIDVPRHKALHD